MLFHTLDKHVKIRRNQESISIINGSHMYFSILNLHRNLFQIIIADSNLTGDINVYYAVL